MNENLAGSVTSHYFLSAYLPRYFYPFPYNISRRVERAYMYVYGAKNPIRLRAFSCAKNE